MKKLMTLLLLVSISSLAQTKGNKKIEKRFYKIENLEELTVDLNAKIIVDLAREEGMSIEMDENLFDKIDTQILNGKLELGQLKWIEPSKEIIIIIGAPKLKRVVQDTHRTLRIENVNNMSLNVLAALGKVIISGKTNNLRLGIENGEIDASQLKVKNSRVIIWGWGKAKVLVDNELFAKLGEDAKLEVVNKPKKLLGDARKYFRKKEELLDEDIKWISFKIKNNSWNRNHFVVVGPKQNGGRFSYGFPMMPGFSKKERWTVGTKVYKVNKIGLRKLLVTITAKDEGKTIQLFE